MFRVIDVVGVYVYMFVCGTTYNNSITVILINGILSLIGIN